MKLSIPILLFLIVSNSLLSQDFSNMEKKDLVKLSGALSLNSTFYLGSAERPPFFWQMSGNLNIVTPLFTIPISLTLSQQQKFSFNDFFDSQSKAAAQPFNQFGMSPKYKSVTSHIGYRSLKFSEFSLSGNQFMGLGLDINPKDKFVKLKLVYGRFAKAIDTIVPGNLSKTFERWGYGINTIIGTEKNNLGFLLFKAKDIKTSISGFDTLVTSKPADNLILGITTKQKISKNLTFEGEIDWSAYTYDTRKTDTKLEGYTYLNNLGSLFYANNSSSLSKAMLWNLNYKKDKLNLKFGYRRVDPDYRTMGSVYLNNDFEDLTGNIKYKFFAGKMGFAFTSGLQRNNLNNDKTSETLRLISSVNSNYSPKDNKWNLNIGFSNFNSKSTMTAINLGVSDTMRFAQVTKSINAQYSINGKLKKNSLSTFISFNFQNAEVGSNIGAQNQEKAETRFYNSSIGSTLMIPSFNGSISIMINGINNINNDFSTSALGPSLNISKSFQTKKNPIRCNFSFSTLKSFLDFVSSGTILNGFFTANYQVTKKQTIGINTSLSKRTANQGDTTEESIVTFNYNYRF
ncbi:hypothetical protein PQZ52_00300 [Flavobacteriales bacterium]|nr:hypothetical protein [Flavobacteriales bacterium]